MAEELLDGTLLPLDTALVGDTLARLYVLVTVPLWWPITKLVVAEYCGPGAPALFATSGADEASALLLLLPLPVGRVTNTVLKTCVVVVRVPLVVVVSGEDPTSSGLEPELDAVFSLPEPSDPDDPDSEPVLPLPLPLPPVDPEPLAPVSAGEGELVKVDPAAVTGHTVVVTAMISVVTEPIWAGQPVMVGAQEVTV